MWKKLLMKNQVYFNKYVKNAIIHPQDFEKIWRLLAKKILNA